MMAETLQLQSLNLAATAAKSDRTMVNKSTSYTVTKITMIR